MVELLRFEDYRLKFLCGRVVRLVRCLLTKQVSRGEQNQSDDQKLKDHSNASREFMTAYITDLTVVMYAEAVVFPRSNFSSQRDQFECLAIALRVRARFDAGIILDAGATFLA